MGSYDNFKGLKSMAKVPWHKLFAQNKLSAPTVYTFGKFFYGGSINCVSCVVQDLGEQGPGGGHLWRVLPGHYCLHLCAAQC